MSSRKHEVPNELLSSLLANYKRPEDLIGENGLLKQLTKLLVEKALDAEMTEHLGHEKHEPVANGAGNTRNGRSRKTLKGDFGELPIEVPRDRQGTFEPKLIPKHQTRWSGFDDKILSLYARGMTVREIQAHLEEMYGAEMSPSLISSVTDAVVDEVKAWPLLRNPLRQGALIGNVAGIALQQHGIAQFAAGCRQGGLAASGDGNRGALGQELACGFQSDTAGADVPRLEQRSGLESGLDA